VVRTKGTFVLVADRWSDQYGGNEERLRRVDVRTGRRVAFTGYGCQGPCLTGTTYDDVVLAATGAGAVEVTDFATGETMLRGFAPGGAVVTLDDGPVEGLRIDGAELVWTRDGGERRAPLPAGPPAFATAGVPSAA